jgi:hypothetical protein
MRTYPIDSPQAKARIVAVALLADGSLGRSELALLDRDSIVESLGMEPEAFDTVIHEFCSDILQYALRDSCEELEIGQEAIDAMLDEICDRDQQRLLLRTIYKIVHADRSLSVGEAVLASQAMERWGMDLHEIGHFPREPARVRSAATAQLGF